MKFLSWGKDGGADSCVDALYVIEAKSLFSVVLLRFGHGSREAYHSHAFKCWNWVLRGDLWEYFPGGAVRHLPRWCLWLVERETMHRVWSSRTSWVFSIRGPWAPTWEEIKGDERYTLGHGRTRT
jgi:hypothetical protein